MEKKHSHLRDQDFMGSSARPTFSGKDGADQERLQSTSVVRGHLSDLLGTLDEIASEAVAMSFIMNIISFFQALSCITKVLFSFSLCDKVSHESDSSRSYGMQLVSPLQGI